MSVLGGTLANQEDAFFEEDAFFVAVIGGLWQLRPANAARATEAGKSAGVPTHRNKLKLKI